MDKILVFYESTQPGVPWLMDMEANARRLLHPWASSLRTAYVNMSGSRWLLQCILDGLQHSQMAANVEILSYFAKALAACSAATKQSLALTKRASMDTAVSPALSKSLCHGLESKAGVWMEHESNLGGQFGTSLVIIDACRLLWYHNPVD